VLIHHYRFDNCIGYEDAIAGEEVFEVTRSSKDIINCPVVPF